MKNEQMSKLYDEVIYASFVARSNRFIATAQAEGGEVICHVKNTGRLKELLLPGAQVILSKSQNPARKTAYDLVAVYKGNMLVNIDSQAPNRAAGLFLQQMFPSANIRREVPFGDSRLDFYVQQADTSLFIEVKGCTQEEGGLAMFPDAPTLRGVKHLHTLMSCIESGHQAMVLFVVQMRPVRAFSPNDTIHAAFGQALRAAKAAGVQVLAYDCLVTEQGMGIHQPVQIML